MGAFMIRLFALVLFMLPVGLLVPILEVSPTHVFNPTWPGHARLHEVWQLIANMAFAGFAIWLAVARKDYRLASIVGLIINGSFLAAVLMAPAYDGTMRHSDGSELAVGGINVAVAIMLVATAGLLALFITALRELPRRGHQPT
jgi:hypothetical protein